ncbi:non-homologous end-joining DNA ligase [Streptomyces alfalfae]|uniref:Non-homologous end-joining DNA ligase n=1 Tax=Streptomyces alfalfae TaxID=1642299 RepID=A0A7T4PJN8_9ACTN|nr:non-homologous end-joining DNA ligase [Streptomyces alfalfae]QQC91371.1 non-homologous end-joining DNA ligase [Streptomyces alfalfae]QUI33867.1 ATP-dependent DNA ligase [Streptomyces alfalfae]
MTPITEVEGRRLSLSNLDKVIYPASGFTKGEVLHYYAATAEVLLPHLRDRPVSFLRYPDGPEGQSFFAKNVPPGAPDWLPTAEVTRSDGATRQVLVQDLASLMWAANTVTEFHTPQWRAEAPARADRLVLDLDPGPPATVVECCRAALWLRDRLRADGFHVYAKTSGSKGLHLLAPLEPTPSERVTAYAKALAVEAEQEFPELVVHRMTRSLRPGKVFVDFSQNAAAKTTATPYTLRARSEPTVSAPVTWEEIEACEEPGQLVFTAGDIAPRVAEHGGDLLAPLFDRGLARALPTGSAR